MLDLISDTQLAYVAGLLDGEGGMSIRIMKTNALNTRVYICNTYKPLMDWLQATFKFGTVNSQTDKRYPNGKVLYRWEVPCAEQKEFLEAILPYLVIKKRRAELVILARTTVKSRKEWNINDDLASQRFLWVEEITKLNERGF